MEVIHCPPQLTLHLFQLYPTQASQCGGSWQCNLLVCKLLPMRGVVPPVQQHSTWHIGILHASEESAQFIKALDSILLSARPILITSCLYSAISCSLRTFDFDIKMRINRSVCVTHLVLCKQLNRLQHRASRVCILLDL